MKLYEIEIMLQSAIDRAEEQAAENEGEISELTSYYLDHWQEQKDIKISNICKLIKNLKAEHEAVANESKRLAERARVAKNKMESVKYWLAGFLNGEKWQDENSKISWRKSEAVEVADESQVPECFIEMKPQIRKADIKEQIKAGHVVPGCSLVEKRNIQIK